MADPPNDVKLKAMIANEAHEHIAPCRDRCDEKRKDIYERIRATDQRVSETREEFARMSGRNGIIMTVFLTAVMIALKFVFKA